MIGRQLALPVGLSDAASFDNFYAPAAEQVVSAVRALAPGDYLYLYGPSGTGKSHLLLAALHAWQERGAPARYVSLVRPPTNLEAPEESALLCMDDLDTVAGNAEQERALLHLFEQVRSQFGALLMAGAVAPAHLEIGLADLKSRLTSGTVFRLRPLTDVEKRVALKLRADSRGFVLGDEVISYVLSRYQRDMGSLFGLLDRLDTESLANQRRVTIPFLQALERRGD